MSNLISSTNETLEWITGDILWNLRVRISEPWKKRTPRKIFETLFYLETSKNDHWEKRGVRMQELLQKKKKDFHVIIKSLMDFFIFFHVKSPCIEKYKRQYQAWTMLGTKKPKKSIFLLCTDLFSKKKTWWMTVIRMQS